MAPTLLRTQQIIAILKDIPQNCSDKLWASFSQEECEFGKNNRRKKCTNVNGIMII